MAWAGPVWACALWPLTYWLSLDRWTCRFHSAYVPTGCKYIDLYGRVCRTSACQAISIVLRLHTPHTDVHLQRYKFISQCHSATLNESNISVFCTGSKEYKSKWEDIALNMDSVLGLTPVASPSCQTLHHSNQCQRQTNRVFALCSKREPM